jgi:hypothetical protein
MMCFDPMELQFTGAILSLAMAIGMLILFMANRSSTPFLYWSLAGVSNAFAYFWATVFDVGALPFGSTLAALNIGLENTLFVLNYVFILLGVLNHLSIQFNIKHILTIITFLFGLQFIAALSYSFEVRITVFTLCVMIIKLVVIYLLYQGIKHSKQLHYLPLFFIEILVLLQLMLRAIFTLFAEVGYIIEPNHPINTTGWLADILYISMVSLACVIVIMKDKHSNDINRL